MFGHSEQASPISEGVTRFKSIYGGEGTMSGLPCPSIVFYVITSMGIRG
jgi:hypothetical protein